MFIVVNFCPPNTSFYIFTCRSETILDTHSYINPEIQTFKLKVVVGLTSIVVRKI